MKPAITALKLLQLRVNRIAFMGVFGIGLIGLTGCGIGLCIPESGCVISRDGSVGGPPGAPSGLVITGDFTRYMASGMYRSAGTPQLTLEEELALGDGPLPAGYREVPDLLLDDDGVTGGGVVLATRPTEVCGTSQASVEARIEHCALLNGSDATWDGELNGNAAQSVWRLVTYNASHEVWRDERTQLLWSDRVGSPMNWCRASGYSAGGPYGVADPNGICSNPANQDQTTPLSACTEAPGLDTSAAYDSMKGGMRAAATPTSPAVYWRLPSKGDYEQAEISGIRFVLPGLLSEVGNRFWTGAHLSFSTGSAITVDGQLGFLSWIGRQIDNDYPRCVGVSAQSPGALLIEGFIDHMGSALFKDVTTVQKTLREELALGPLPLSEGYRRIPNLTSDSFPATAIATSVRPTEVCGMTQASVQGRVDDCAEQNGVSATWDGTVLGHSGQGQWRLVTYTGTYEVWRDERTRLVWSDRFVVTNWCQAAGVSGGGPFGQVDPAGYCDDAGLQDQVTPTSYCAEHPDLSTPDAVDARKGGLRKAASGTSPSVSWRLPTRWDYQQAEIHGVQRVLPALIGAGFNMCTSTIRSTAPVRNEAYLYTPVMGSLEGGVLARRNEGCNVICVGR